MGTLRDGWDIFMSIFGKIRACKKRMDDEELTQQYEDIFNRVILQQWLMPIMKNRVTAFKISHYIFLEEFSDIKQEILERCWDKLKELPGAKYKQNGNVIIIDTFDFVSYMCSKDKENDPSI